MKQQWKRRWKPAVLSLLICLAVFAACLLLRRTGRLSFLEFWWYDRQLAAQPRDARAAGKVVIVGIDETDLRALGHYPLTDDDKTKLLETLVALGPLAIGVDLYMDELRPAHGADSSPGLERLGRVLLENRNIIVAALASAAGFDLIPPPAVLANRPRRIGYVDVPLDDDAVVRRGMLFFGRQGEKQTLSVGVANQYLERLGTLPSPTPLDPAHRGFWTARLPRFRGNDGSYVDADDGGDQYLLDFRGPDRYETLALRQVLPELATDAPLPAVRPSQIEGKVVLIGMTPESVKDRDNTPIEQHRRGVAIHATAVDQLLRTAAYGARPPRVWADRWEELWMLLFALGGGALGYRVRSLWRLSFFGLVSVAALVATAWLAFRHGLWIPMVPLLICWLAALAGAAGYRAARESADRNALTQLFGRMVQKEVADELWDNREELLEGGRLRPREVVATLLFSDLKGYTGAVENLDPGRLMDWLNEYMEVMTGVAIRNGGVVIDYMGDGLMIAFGAPVCHTTDDHHRQDALNAVACAVEMRQGFAEICRRWAERGQPCPQVRIGIFTGPVVVGSLGDRQRLEFAIIGDAVNTAARLEAYDKSLMDPDIAAANCRILIGEPTCRYVAGEFSTRRIGTVELAGKRERVLVYGVIGPAAGPTSAGPRQADSGGGTDRADTNGDVNPASAALEAAVGPGPREQIR